MSPEPSRIGFDCAALSPQEFRRLGAQCFPATAGSWLLIVQSADIRCFGIFGLHEKEKRMNDTPEAIHEVVREHYAGRIKSSGACCGSDSPGSGRSDLYPAELLATLPEGDAPVSYGCGDPITLASLEPGQTVLDLGSGAGLDCFFAARKVGPTGRVIGVDMTPEMIERARTAATRLGLGNVEFRHGLLEQLPVEDDTIDVTISNCVINLAPDKATVFNEVFRVLKPGGKLAVSDIVTDGPLPPSVKSSLSAWAGCIAGALDVKDYQAAMEDAGLVDIEIVPSYFDEATIDEAIKDVGDRVDLRGFSRDKFVRTVFSARITARKP
jgi:ubiquinone/menaquinone biosynthesis C-methylase UbiE